MLWKESLQNRTSNKILRSFQQIVMQKSKYYEHKGELKSVLKYPGNKILKKNSYVL